MRMARLPYNTSRPTYPRLTSQGPIYDKKQTPYLVQCKKLILLSQTKIVIRAPKRDRLICCKAELDAAKGAFNYSRIKTFCMSNQRHSGVAPKTSWISCFTNRLAGHSSESLINFFAVYKDYCRRPRRTLYRETLT